MGVFLVFSGASFNVTAPGEGNEVWYVCAQMDRHGIVSMQNAYKMPTRTGYAEKGCWQNVHNPLFLLACPEGFEPPTVGLEGRCSIQLSYGQMPRNALPRQAR